MTQLNITIDTPASVPFVVVNGTAVLSGVLSIELGDVPVQSGDRIDIISATSISGAFASVEVTRNGTKDCTGADLTQEAGLLTALMCVSLDRFMMLTSLKHVRLQGNVCASSEGLAHRANRPRRHPARRYGVIAQCVRH